ncbi:acyl-CoA carboxylase epsilon subunit [Streptomyces platensis]
MTDSLRVLRGNPNEEELTATVLAILATARMAASAGAADEPARPVRALWPGADDHRPYEAPGSWR